MTRPTDEGQDELGPPPRNPSPDPIEEMLAEYAAERAAADASNPRGSSRAPRRKQGLLGSSAVVAAGTGLSRISGLLRWILIANVIGTAALGDAYNIANQTPNTIYDLVLGGVIAATLIPVIVERFEHDDQRAVDAVASVITFGLIALTVIATLLSPFIIRLYTIGKNPEDA